MIVIAALLAGCMVFTAYSASSSLAGPHCMGKPPQMQSDQQMQDGPPSGQSQEGQDQQNQQNQDQQNQNQQDLNSNDQNSQSQNSQNQSSDQNDRNGGQPSAPPDGNGPPDGNSQPPTPPDGNGPPDGNSQPPDGTGPKGSPSLSDISVPYYIMFGIEGLAFALVLIYLILSKLNLRTAGEVFGSRKRIAAGIIAALLLGGCLVPAQAALTTKVFAGSNMKQGSQQMQGGPGSGQGPGGQGSGGQDSGGQGPGGQESSVEATGATTVDGTKETLNDEYTSTNADENAILVTNGGALTSDGATINKKSGDSSSTESSDFSGVNSGLLVQENSTATVRNATIRTSAGGANAVFATGENAKITISDSTITTTGERSSRGLDATYGGTIKADKVKITTQGGSCAAMATDRGEGTVTAANSTLETNGAGSPIIYSTGDITLTDSKGTANGAQITVVEGKNSATIKGSTVTCSGAGNRGDVDIAGVMIYQSMSGDADEGTGNFTAKDSTLSISKDSDYYKTAPMFFVTNTNAVIDLEDTELDFGSGTLLSACGTSEWGTEGSNGGNVTLNAKAEKLQGNIDLDEISSLSMNLTDSTYKGTINGDNEAGSVKLTLDSDSKITLTGDSYVTSLKDADADYSNIDFNGHILYVNGKAIK